MATSLSLAVLFLPSAPTASAATFDYYSLASVGNQFSGNGDAITLSTTLSSTDTITCPVANQTIYFWSSATAFGNPPLGSAVTDADGLATFLVETRTVFEHFDVMVEIQESAIPESTDVCGRAYNAQGSVTFFKYQPVTTVDCPADAAYTGADLTPCTAETVIYDASINDTKTITTPTDMTLTYADNRYVGTAMATGDYAGDGYNETSTASDTFAITDQHMTIVGPGAYVVSGTTSAVLSAQVTASQVCMDSATVQFVVEDLFSPGAPVTYTAVLNTSTGVATYTLSPLVAGHVYAVTATVLDANIDGVGADECIGDSDVSGSVTVLDPAAASQGGGWYFPSAIGPSGVGNPKVNFGYTVNVKVDKRAGTAVYSGNLLWNVKMQGQLMRLKGKVTSYGKIACPTTTDTFTACVQISGTGYVYVWIDAVGETPGYWNEGVPVTFTTRAYDGGVARMCTTKGKKTTCSEQTKPDAFQLVSLTSEGSTLFLEEGYALMRGGSVTIR